MSECVVVGCSRTGEIVAGKPTPWGAWEYWVCLDHKAEIDDGAVIHDNSDGRTITVSLPG
ncbi:MAG: hypothetical protein INR66_24035 [Gordonia polyisoprenivorans]|nr:hypothetical protein [Gordonia polyisoprenivorans]